MNEAGLNAKWIRADMTHESCQEFTKRTLRHMLEPPLRLPGACTATSTTSRPPPPRAPATASPSTTWSATPTSSPPPSRAGTPYYTNSSHLPVGYTDDIFAALDIQDELQTLYTSGTVFHAFLGEKLPGLAGRRHPRAQDSRELQAALLHAQPDLLRLQERRLPRRRAVRLPALRRERRGLQPHHRLLPPGAELERRKDPGVQGAQDLRHGPQPPRPGQAPGRMRCFERRGLRLRRGARTWTGTSAAWRPLLSPCRPPRSAANSQSASEGPVPGGHNLLFTTPTCPNCRLAVTMLDKQHFAI